MGVPMKRSGPALVAAILVGLVAMAPPSPEPRHGERTRSDRSRRLPPASIGTEDDPDAQAEMEFLMLRDPRANAIPRDIRKREVLFARSLLDRRARPFRTRPNGVSQFQELVWTERGPNNVGGRTRAFAVDVAS